MSIPAEDGVSSEERREPITLELDVVRSLPSRADEAFALYVRTGGPRPAAALQAARNIVDRVLASQGAHGYWCYVDGSCRDSSTTYFRVAKPRRKLATTSHRTPSRS